MGEEMLDPADVYEHAAEKIVRAMELRGELNKRLNVHARNPTTPNVEQFHDMVMELVHVYLQAGRLSESAFHQFFGGRKLPDDDIDEMGG